MTYRLVTTVSGDKSYPGIQCLRCGRISYNANDIAQRYCARCHHFHDRSTSHKPRSADLADLCGPADLPPHD